MTQPRKEIPIYSSPGSNPHAPLNPFMRVNGELWKLVGRKGSLGVFEKVEPDNHEKETEDAKR